MRERVAKFMHSTKRPNDMSAEEKGEHSAAIKVTKLYSQIISRNKGEEEVEAIKNNLDDEHEVFCSQQYNKCFMNIYGFTDEE